MTNYIPTNEELTEKLDDFINGLFVEFQEKNDIPSGDISPMMALQYGTDLEALVNTLKAVMNEQLGSI